ncbi:synaptic vesicle glycoprotein 2B-like isoform X1 [Neodiprion virginianus]|uniref:synaptic vesicle glycoprotein 2B-like isoform X1 n=2 Tax=Neodiprion virginianus TaxID=2961670 RepID=UPI001EE76A2D|nr:synaptic vesicle glycoprotein 2B-like isoform X1 [Neodiprion virginianus]
MFNDDTKEHDAEKVQLYSRSAGDSNELNIPHDFDEAIEATGYGLFNVLLILAILPGAWANFFDTTVMSYVLPVAECDLQITFFQKGMLNAAVFAGMFTAAFPWGVLADTKGRRTLLRLGYCCDCICNILCSMSQNFYVLLTFKFLSGCIMSGPYAVNMTYLAEFHSGKYRSKVVLWARLFPSLGSIVLPGLAWIVIPQPWSFTLFNGTFVYNSWRIFILICSMPALLGFIILRFLPESPRFLMSQGRSEEAMEVFRRIYAMNTGKAPETFPVKALRQDDPKRKTEAVDTSRRASVWEKIRNGGAQVMPLFQKPHFCHFLLIITIQFGGLLSLNTLRLWMPQLFTLMEDFKHKKHNVGIGRPTLCNMISTPSNSNFTTYDEINSTMAKTCDVVPVYSRVYINSIILAITIAIACSIAGSLVNRIGKKNLLLVAFLIPAVCAFLLNWSPNSDATLTLLAIYMASGNVSVTTIISFTVDLMPTTLRATAVTLAMAAGRIGAMFGNLLFPLLLSTGCMAPFIFVGGFLLACFSLSIFIPKPPSRLI